MPRFFVTQSVVVEVEINDLDAIERFTGPQGDETRAASYPLFTRDDVIEHLAYNATVNGQENATILDGFADLPPEAVRMRVKNVYVDDITVVDEPEED